MILHDHSFPIDRLQHVEQELRYQRRVIELLLAHFAARPGADLLPPPLVELLKADDPATDARIVDAVSAHLKAKRQDLAVLLLREETAARWDELHALAARWPSMPEADRRRWVRGRRLARVLDRVAG